MEPPLTKSSEYETSFGEISVPFNEKNIQDTKTKIEIARLKRQSVDIRNNVFIDFIVFSCFVFFNIYVNDLCCH